MPLPCLYSRRVWSTLDIQVSLFCTRTNAGDKQGTNVPPEWGMCRGAESTTPTNGKGVGEGGTQEWQKAIRSLAKGGGLSGAGIREVPPGSFRGASYSGYRCGLPLSGGPGYAPLGRPPVHPRTVPSSDPPCPAFPSRTDPGGTLGLLVFFAPPGRRRRADGQVAEGSAERSPLPSDGETRAQSLSHSGNSRPGCRELLRRK